MNDIAKRLQRLFADSGLSYGDLAVKTNLPKSALQRYISGTTDKIPLDRLEKMAIALGSSPEYVMGWDEDSELTKIGAVPFWPSAQRIPLLGRVAAGMPMYAEENIEGYIPLDRDDGHKYFGLRIHGDSMTAAGMDDGDIIVVRQQDMVEENDIAVVLVNGYDATVKYWHRQGSTVILTPKSYNPEHQPQIYDAKKVPIRVLGRVVQIRKDL